MSRHSGHFSDSEKTLHIMGVAVDTIRHLGESVPVAATLPKILAICRMWESLKVWSAAYNGGGTLIDAFVKTLLCGQVKEDQAPSAGAIPTLEEARRVFFSLIQNGYADSEAGMHGDIMRLYLRGRRFGTRLYRRISGGSADQRPGMYCAWLLYATSTSPCT